MLYSIPHLSLSREGFIAANPNTKLSSQLSSNVTAYVMPMINPQIQKYQLCEHLCASEEVCSVKHLCVQSGWSDDGLFEILTFCKYDRDNGDFFF